MTGHEADFDERFKLKGIQNPGVSKDEWISMTAEQKRDHIQGKPPMDDEACILMVQGMITVEPLPEREQFNPTVQQSSLSTT